MVATFKKIRSNNLHKNVGSDNIFETFIDTKELKF